MALSPYQAGNDVLKRARSLLRHARRTTGRLRDDLLRQALAMGVAALDTYLHNAIRDQVSEQRRTLPKQLKNLEIKFEDIVTLADDVVKARNAQPPREIRPWVTVKNFLYKRLLEKTLQSSSQVEDAMNMVGVSSCWSAVAPNMGLSVDAIKERLNEAVRRRNKIVHEGDLERSSRPHQVKHNPIEEIYVLENIDFLGMLMSELDKLF